MDKILIIKLGALGDVVRTTPILRALKGNITWVTHPQALPLLKNNPKINQLYSINNCRSVAKERYQLVLNLDEDQQACALAEATQKQELIGVYRSGSSIQYTQSSKQWFDMSLISRYGKAAADRKKMANRKSYQEILFGMIGEKFKGEEYFLPLIKTKPQKKYLVGLEARSGDRWMAKRWPYFAQLTELLKKQNQEYVYFEMSRTLEGFIRQIAQCEVVITSDSLALHLALGLQKKVIALFTCTSPHEIHGYDRTTKIISPKLKKFYYSTKRTLEPGRAIAAKTVYQAYLQQLK